MAKSISMYVRFDEDFVERMDDVIKKKGYDSRASFLRKAAFEKVILEEDRILA